MNKSQIKDLLIYYLHIRQKPLTLQMPITSRCNSRCKTCNIWKYHDNVDIDCASLEKALKDSFFSEVRTVGLNGGEFTLVPNFIDVVKTVLTLPKLRNIYCISNGLLPKKLFEYLFVANKECKKKNVNLHICISVDGFGAVHENVRGVPHCFSKTIEILDELSKNKERYCSSFSVGCTISKYNIDYIKETQNFFDGYPGLNVEYHCAIPNKRIKTFDDADDYYVLKDNQKRLLAAEFFYERYLLASSFQNRYQNFANFYYLTHNGKERLNTCAYTNRDVTIDENLNLMLCATASGVIGNLRERSATEIIKSKKCKKILNDNLSYCNSCGHYSYHPLTLNGRLKYIKFEMQNRYVWEYYDHASKGNIFVNFCGKVGFIKRFAKEYLRQIYWLIWKLQ